MPQFCRHNRFLHRCPICRPQEPPPAPKRGQTGTHPRPAAGGGSEVRVRRVARVVGDGYRSELVPGLHARDDARRLAAELAFAAARLAELAAAPPGLYAEVASEPDPEEAIWLAFLIAYLSPLEGDDPFAGIAAARTRWRDGGLPNVEGVATGPRGAHDPARGAETLAAYRRFAERAGSQLTGLTGEEHWPPERRFARAFERLALPGLQRAARVDFLVTLGRTGRLEARPGSLFLAAAAAHDPTALAARRVLGIADPLLLDRRAIALAEACDVPLAAVELALWNWQADPADRATLGASAAAGGDEAASAGIEASLAVPTLKRRDARGAPGNLGP